MRFYYDVDLDEQRVEAIQKRKDFMSSRRAVVMSIPESLYNRPKGQEVVERQISPGNRATRLQVDTSFKRLD